MVFPLIPIVVGIAAGGAGFGIGNLLGGKKEQVTTTTQTTYAPTTSMISPYAYYQPSLQFAPQYGYSYAGGDVIISSPSAETKKETSLEQKLDPSLIPTYTMPYTLAPTVAPEQKAAVGGTDMTMLAIIGIIGLIGYGLVSKRERK